MTPEQKQAIQYYKEATQLERNGKLTEALTSYRKAYKLDEFVEDLIHSEQKSAGKSSQVNKNSDNQQSIKKSDKQLSDLDIEQLLNDLHNLKIDNVIVKASNYRHNTHISQLPAEIFTSFILPQVAQMDAPSVERFGQVCRQFYKYTRDDNLWKQVCRYYHRSSSQSLAIASPLPNDQLYRDLFLSTPRLRYDGVYISRCTYARQGLSEHTFSQPYHLVVYYRFLRFYPDGSVISLLSNREPQDVISMINQDEYFAQQKIRSKQKVDTVVGAKESGEDRLMRGMYFLDIEQNINSNNNNNKSSKGYAVKISLEDSAHRKDSVFHMVLNLSYTHRGAWNKLGWSEYYSVKGSTSTEYSLHQFKPYYFSRVKSIVRDIKM
ncbi:hypothetical protein MP228_001925 [Amoeboaphelidium protococcarum]|nr:hypothetical protein MP228_001925 [Amoeboaphelidium protococcarum]